MATNQSPGAPVAAESAVPTLRVMRLQSPELYQVGPCCISKRAGRFIRPTVLEKHWNLFALTTELSAVILDFVEFEGVSSFIFHLRFATDCSRMQDPLSIDAV